MEPSLLLLAAGMGSRYGGLKQIDAFGPNGESILDYSIYDAIRAGFKKFIFIIREEIRSDFEDFFKGKFPTDVEVHYIAQNLDDIPEGFQLNPERKKPLGTAHAVWVARHIINEPFGVINADDYYGRESLEMLYKYLNNWKSGNPEKMCTVGYLLGNTLSDHGAVNRGVCNINSSKALESITERKGIKKEGSKIACLDDDGNEVILTDDTVVSMNMYGLTSLFMYHTSEMMYDFIKNRGQELKSELFIPSVVTDLIQSEKLVMDVITSPSSWFGVTYQEDKPVVSSKIDKLIEAGVYPKDLWD